MRHLSALFLAGTAFAMIMPVFAAADDGGTGGTGGDGGNAAGLDADNGGNVVTIDLSGVMTAVHDAESLEAKAETFVSGIIDRLKGIATQPNPPDTTELQAQVQALADELSSKNSEFKSSLSQASGNAGTDPAVTSLAPSTGAEAGGDTVVITGKNLTGALAVNFGPSAAASYTVDSDTQITAVTPPGTGGVTVAVQGPLSQSSQVGSFSYVPAAAKQAGEAA